MKIPCTIDESLYRPEVVRWRERMSLLEPLGDVVVVLPCSMRKPYTNSKSHSVFMRATKGVQEAILTSPFGVCPREMDRTYPIQSYDTSTTGDWSHEEIDLTGECLKSYVDGKDVIAHVSGGYREACEAHLEDAIYTVEDGRATSWESMDNLKKELRNYPRIKNSQKRINGFRSIARYQFNTKKGDSFIPDETKAVGRFTRKMIYNHEQFATLSFDTGLYSLNLPGGEKVYDMGVNWVEIDFEMKTNTLFTPGVVDADPNIVPMDEVVVVRDGEVMAVGKSVLSGKEMKSATKGVAVKIRHRKKN